MKRTSIVGAAAVAGACIGFLRYNFNPAKIFMSTVGAQFLGLMLAAISIVGTFKVAAAISVAVPVLVLGVPIFDYGIVLMRRLANKAPLTAAEFSPGMACAWLRDPENREPLPPRSRESLSASTTP